MAWGKSDEQKQQDRDLQEDRLKDKKASEEAAEFAASPVGQATAAYRNGDELFQLEVTLSDVKYSRWSIRNKSNVEPSQPWGPLLSAVEAVGWRLEHTGFVFIETGFRTVHDYSAVSGEVMGVYVFRRAGGHA